jgi:hypothetical protein
MRYKRVYSRRDERVLSMSIESETDNVMPIVRDHREGRLRRFLDRLDVFYTLPVLIAVAAFIIAVLAYFGTR